MKEPRPPHRPWWVLGLVGVVAGSVWLALAWGPGELATPDSASYLEGARHLASGKGFTSAVVPIGQTELRPITVFAPGFSWLMAPGVFAGMSALKSAAFVLASSFVLYALGTYLLVLAATRWKWPAATLLVTAVVTCQPGSLRALDSILSDLTFAASCTVALSLALRFIREEAPSKRRALALGACLGLCVLVRWAGLYLLIACLIGILVSLPGQPGVRQRLRSTARVFLGSFLVTGPWLLRNLISAGELLGSRRMQLGSPLEAAREAWQGLTFGYLVARDVIRAHPALSSTYGIWSCTAAILVLGVFVHGRMWKRDRLRLLVCVGTGYTLLMILSASTHNMDALSSGRFWLPVTPIVAALALGTLTEARLNRWSVRAIAVVALVPVLATAGLFQHAISASLPSAHQHVGLLWKPLRESVPVRFALQDSTDCVLLSNDPRILLIHGQQDVVHTLPESSEEILPLFSGESPVCIVYFTEPGARSVEQRRRANQVLLAELVRANLIRRVAKDRTGEVWISD